MKDKIILIFIVTVAAIFAWLIIPVIKDYSYNVFYKDNVLETIKEYHDGL